MWSLLINYVNVDHPVTAGSTLKTVTYWKKWWPYYQMLQISKKDFDNLLLVLVHGDCSCSVCAVLKTFLYMFLCGTRCRVTLQCLHFDFPCPIHESVKYISLCNSILCAFSETHFLHLRSKEKDYFEMYISSDHAVCKSINCFWKRC